MPEPDSTQHSAVQDLEAHGPSIPEVSFDVKLGKKYKHVDFDYGAYKQMITDMGGEEEDFQNASIQIKPKKPFFGGRYAPYNRGVPEEGTTEVFGRPKKANKTLAHETQHYLDDINHGL